MPRPRPAILVLAAAIAALAVLVGINVPDQQPSAEARGLFERPPRAFSRESGWALLAGFNAPAGQDPRAYARASAAPSPGERRVRHVQPVGSGDQLGVRAAAELLCSPESVDCVRAFSAKPQSIDEMAADNAVLLARYDELLRSSGLADVVHGLDSWDVSFTSGGTVLGVQRIRLSQAGAAAARGRLDAALAWLEADAAFYRRWLDEADTLLSKMLAARGLSRSLIAAGQVARAAPALTAAQVEVLGRMTEPLSGQERGIARPIRAEAVLLAEMLDELIESPRATRKVTGATPFLSDVAGRTLRRNATLNFAAPLYTGWMRLDALDTIALAPEIARLRAAANSHLERDWTWLYNYPGKALVTEGVYDVSEYVLRLRDVDALASLLRCATTLRARAIPRESAVGFVAADPACLDPYLGRSFAWNDARAEISFKPGNEKNAERFGGANGRVTFAPYPR